MIASGVLLLKYKDGELLECPFLQDFLDRFYMSRIGIRLLISQHIDLHYPKAGFVGMINYDLSPVQVAEDAASDARMICEKKYGIAPYVKVLGDRELKICYMPSHLEYMFTELLKNSMRGIYLCIYVSIHLFDLFDLFDLLIYYFWFKQSCCGISWTKSI